MEHEYKISIIIPAYNSEKNIEECLKSICNESKNFESEIIVIDDGSIDKTSEIVKKFKTIKLIKLKKNKGVGYVRNLGARLEKYKKVDLVICAFNKLGYKLKIIGRGVDKENLRKIAKPNIEFLEGIDDKELADIYSKCKALIFPQHEDYGLTPLEANASGRPVIAYRKGGIETTMIPFNQEKPELPFTALFFNKQTVESLVNAVKTMCKLNVDSSFIREHSEKYDDDQFIKKIKDFVYEQYSSFK